MKKIKEHYPHIHRQLQLLESEKDEILVKYIQSITIYELTEDRKESRMGFDVEAFEELVHILDNKVKDYEIKTTRHPSS